MSDETDRNYVVRVTKNGVTRNYTMTLERPVAEQTLKDARTYAGSNLTSQYRGAVFSLARVVYEPLDEEPIP